MSSPPHSNAEDEQDVSPSECDCPCHEIEELRAKLDKKIHGLLLQVSELRTQRNRLADISYLPSDVLSRIFSCVVKDTEKLERRKDALTAGWICRDWRQVALGTVQLWNHIDLEDIRWFTECVKRSGQAGLTIKIIKPAKEKIELALYKAVAAVLPRVEVLHLVSSWLVSYRQIDLWKKPASRLKELKLHDVKIHPTIHSGVIPPLQSVELNHCSFIWDVPFFNGLTVLKILRPPSGVELSEFFAKLLTMPNLTELVLDGVLKAKDPATPTLSTLSLPRLTLLHLSAEMGTVTTLLESLEFTKKAKVTLDVYEDKEGPTGLGLALRALVKSMDNSLWDIHTLSAGANWQRSEFIFYAKTKKTQWSMEKEEVFRVKINRPDKQANVLFGALAELHLDHLETVILNAFNVELAYETWNTVFGSLPKLTKVKTRYEFASDFLRYLGEEGKKLIVARDAGTPKEALTEMISFKKLETVSVESFTDEEEDDEYDLFPALYRALALRKEHGFKVTSLWFLRCDFFTYRVKKLENVVSEVIQAESIRYESDEYHSPR